VSHTLDNTKVLNNLNIKTPSPIKYDYDWPGRFKPFIHQLKTAEFLTLYNRCFVLNEIGTGKSMSALWAADYLMKIGEVNKVLIISPLSTLERVWGDEIFRNFTRRKFSVLHGTRAKRLELLADTKTDFYIINHDGFDIIYEELLDREDIDLIIVDECAVYRNSRTDRWKLFNQFIKERIDLKLWMMTATPTPNEPTDAWAQVRLVNPTSVPKFFGRFRDLVMRKISTFKWVPKHDAIDTVRRVMVPSIRFTRNECLDLPETTYQTRQADLTAEQVKVFKDIQKKLHAEVAEGSITAANEAVKMLKLLQVSTGVVYNDDGSHVHLDSSPRIHTLLEVLEEAGEKAIVFVPFRGVLAQLETALSKHYTVGVIHGGVPKKARDKIFSSFQNSKHPQILLAHPKTMSHGLTLTRATTIVWYSPYPSCETYEQANGRITRQGQKNKTTIVHIECTPMERQIFNRLKHKQKMQGILLDSIRNHADLL
jgi:SNF2 family DNA or RNA helicase